MKIHNNYNDPYLLKLALAGYKKQLGNKKFQVLKKIEYFEDGKIQKGHYLDITV